jgi:translation initiation factor 3 subunit G
LLKDSDNKPGIFVPPALRGGNRRGETMMNQSNRKDETTIRVSNLPESMSETDMQELCTPFGKIERIFLAKDR